MNKRIVNARGGTGTKRMQIVDKRRSERMRHTNSSMIDYRSNEEQQAQRECK